MPNIPGGNPSNAEGAQGMTASGPNNVFPFQGEPSNPNVDQNYDLSLDAVDTSLDPPEGRPKLQNHSLPMPLA